MAVESRRPLKVFLCHASGDKPAVRALYKRLLAEGVDAWLDQEKLLPGQDWRVEIPRAVREADVVVICLSNKSITKEGYVQKEIRFALDSAEEKPEGTIFLIPARLEDCVVPERFDRWQWVDLFEENGFMRLLRSLKIRADVLGATIEPTGYESEDQETERRLDQLYTEGLAAFWVEDWDRACQRFQAILRERPNHKNAAEKLEQAERQRSLAKLYVQGTEAYKSENRAEAIKAFEGLLEKSADYKDAVQILKDARRQKQLRELYAEAKRLHLAQKWQAVTKVFDQIAAIDREYPDPENLLPSAQGEAAEQKRLADLTDLYRQGVHQMDAGQWYEARTLLEQVHKAQLGFLDTERLLRKAEDEIARVEERRARNNQINTLYEQAHGLIRSKSWRMVLDKMEEIQRLDEQFVDKDGIFEQAKAELEREEQAAQRQNALAAMYAESVRLLKEGKYQGALDKWQEVKSIDPKYPDRQRVQRTARKNLTQSATLVQTKSWINKSRLVWIVSAAITLLVFVGIYFVYFYKPSCASIQECQQFAEKATQRSNPGLALTYFNLAIDMVPFNLKPQYSSLWRERADIQETLKSFDAAQRDRDIGWLYDRNVQKIIFNSDRDGNNEIYVTDIKGEKVVRLTFDPSNDQGPMWSPDGGTIAFASDRSGNMEVYVMDADGSNIRNLTRNPVFDSSASWSPDGTKIAFQTKRRDRSDDIYVMNADGSSAILLFPDSANDWGPVWSPDGRKIAYSTDAFGNQEFVVVNVDGSNLQNLSNNESDDFFPSWSPDGKKIAFTSMRYENYTTIFVLSLENQQVEQLSTTHGWGSKWSPDGNKLVFTSYSDEKDNEIVWYDLRTKKLTFITNNSANDELPSWSPLP